jgi:hypothetical protein
MIKSIIQKFQNMKASNCDQRITIGVTTFERRFEKYFKPLLLKIREFEYEAEIIIAVNGEHNRQFGEEYRSEILKLISQQKNVFPIFFPQFRGLSKLWNTIIIHASHDHILMLNDDIMIKKETFLQEISKGIEKNNGKSFVINDSWSHFLINKAEIDELGWFDERLLGIGEEDGDLSWRYINLYGHPIAKFKISGIQNFAEDTMGESPLNIISRPNMKYSEFNRVFIMRKYQPHSEGIRGMFDGPVRIIDTGERQYPNEKFFLKNKDKL